MKIIITMAGKSSRFFSLGIKKPKYELIANGQTLFYWSMVSLKYFIDEKTEFIFVCQLQFNAKQFIIAECKKLNIKNYSIIELDEFTNGQANTAYFATRKMNNCPVAIFNIDTHVSPYCIKNCNGVGHIPVFKTSGSNWSYIAEENSVVPSIKEKAELSHLATVGVYYFNSSKLFNTLYEETQFKGEHYVSYMYQILLSTGKVRTTILPENSVVPLGVPAEVIKFMYGQNCESKKEIN